MMAPAARARLKAGVIAAVSVCGGVEGAGATVDKSRSLAGTWRNRNDEALPRVDDAYQLDQVAVLQGLRPPILCAYAADLGHVVIRLPDADAGESGLSMSLIDATAEFGDIAREVCEATRDGTVCAADRHKIIGQIDETLEALARMRAAVCREQ